MLTRAPLRRLQRVSVINLSLRLTRRKMPPAAAAVRRLCMYQSSVSVNFQAQLQVSSVISG